MADPEQQRARARESAGTLAMVRRTARLLVMSAWTPTIVSWEAVRAIFFRGDRRIIIDRAKHAWAIVSKFVLGVDIHLVRGAMPDRHSKRARLIVSNHRTPLDIVSLMWLFGGHFLANHKTRTAPVVGIAAIRMGTIFVDRDDRRSGVNAIRAMRRALEDGQSIIIFPEGTTYEGDEVRPFKGGAFLAAKGLDVDVIPVGLAYHHGASYFDESLGQHARRFLSRKRNPVWVAIGDPIPFPADHKGAEDLIRAAVQAMVDEARTAAGGGPTPRALSPENETKETPP
jgi:1-acyl-sn-glycerol-3-phosphate acyltransferase